MTGIAIDPLESSAGDKGLNFIFEKLKTPSVRISF